MFQGGNHGGFAQQLLHQKEKPIMVLAQDQTLSQTCSQYMLHHSLYTQNNDNVTVLLNVSLDFVVIRGYVPFFI
jgi:hypothetical protein